MTANKAHKRAVRARMAETGETYTQAARRLDNAHPYGNPDEWDEVPEQLLIDLVERLTASGYAPDKSGPGGVAWTDTDDPNSEWELGMNGGGKWWWGLYGDDGCDNPELLTRGGPHADDVEWLADQAIGGLPETIVRKPATRPTREDFGGHEFEYESRNDLFKCVYCQEYEIVVRADDGTIAPCKGLVDYGDDTERVYLLVTTNPDPRMPGWCGTHLAWQIGKTRIGRVPRYASRDDRMLVESAPSVVDELEQRIEAMTIAVVWGQARVVASIERLTAEQGRQIMADNYAAAVAKYGADEVPPPEFGVSGV